ncbi:MAG: carboxypeptidase-like regulatory domain-containing protein [Cyclobacteriaceae bacterium]|nr:carboxypeptidase-like regulatory domain-containing protein [Cyclobacteriaceae bacterium]
MKFFAFLITITLFTTSFAPAPMQLINTSLTVTVRDELGNTVEGANIKLFDTEENYNKETNPVAEGTTDAKGSYRFKKIKASAYYVLAKKGDKDNTGGGEKIGKLEEGKFNKVTIVIQ